jgi:hypothetical protein
VITSPELEDSIERLTHTDVALIATSRRLGAAFAKALETADVDFHAVNDGTTYAAGNGFEVVQLALRWDHPDDPVQCLISDSLGYIDGSSHPGPMVSITSLNDSQMAEIAKMWAEHIAARSKHLVFGNMYIPHAVEARQGFNDLRVAFRIVRAWDVIHCAYVLRIDAAFKDLSK